MKLIIATVLLWPMAVCGQGELAEPWDGIADETYIVHEGPGEALWVERIELDPGGYEDPILDPWYVPPVTDVDPGVLHSAPAWE